MKKRCSKCGEVKGVDEFYGNEHKCRECRYKARLTICVKCENCDIFFMSTKQHANQEKRYCSPYCAGIAKKRIKRPKHVLDIMKKTWIKKGQRLSSKTEFKKGHNGGYGWKKGHVAWNDTNTIIACAYCKKKIKTKPFRINKNKNNFCSKECSDKFAFKGGASDSRNKLKDVYVKNLIVQQHNISRQDITPEMIELKRELIIMHRNMKGVRDELNSTRD
jgi:hypothetical protein